MEVLCGVIVKDMVKFKECGGRENWLVRLYGQGDK